MGAKTLTGIDKQPPQQINKSGAHAILEVINAMDILG
jgi:hypothetical protein